MCATSASTQTSTQYALCAINPDKSLKWTYTLPTTEAPVGIGPVCGSDGSVYFMMEVGGFHGGELVALNSEGTHKWSYPLAAEDFGPWQAVMVAPDNTVYLTADFTDLVALDSDGSLKWSLADTGGIYNFALGPDGTIYYVDYAQGTNLVAVNPAGAVKWTTPIAAASGSQLSVGSDGTVYLTADFGAAQSAGYYGLLKAYTPAGVQKWAVPTNAIRGPIIGGDGAIYLVGADVVEAVH